MKSTLTRKGYGRIYVENKDDIQKVKDIVKELSEFEFDYLPKDLIAVSTEYPKTCYIGKFDDLDMNVLTSTCWIRGIKIWVFDNGHDEF